MGPDGTCPTCGKQIAEAKAEPRAPWHFVLLLIALAIYLGYRAIQGIIWLTHHV